MLAVIVIMREHERFFLTNRRMESGWFGVKCVNLGTVSRTSRTCTLHWNNNRKLESKRLLIVIYIVIEESELQNKF